MISLTDAHSHILFAVDDGAGDIEESMEMLKMEAAEGVGTVFLTPHFYEGEKNSSHLEEKFALLKERAEKEIPGMRLFLGNEIFCMYDPAGALLKGEALSYDKTRYALCEFSPGGGWESIKRCVESLLREGYIPVIAHAERYVNVYRKTERLRELTKMGALIQINAATLTSAGFMEKRYLKRIILEGLVFVFGSDCHDTKERAPQMRKAYEWTVKNAGQERADDIFSKNALKFIKERKQP